MQIGFSICCHWAPLRDLKETEPEGQENVYFDDSAFDLENMEAIWVVLDCQKAPQYLTLTVGCEMEEYLFTIDLTGATSVLQHEDGRVLYIRNKGGEKDGLRI